MSAPAAIQAQLVDVRNVAAHKCIRLELHVPAEQAGLVLAAFGWPTAVDPVPVALARLGVPEPQPPRDVLEKVLNQGWKEPPRERKAWADLPPSQQAAMRCGEPEFREFLRSHGWVADTADEAAATVRYQCAVQSRADLNTSEIAASQWRRIDDLYFKWQRGAR